LVHRNVYTLRNHDSFVRAILHIERLEMKYELTDETKKVGDVTLYRIRALKDFGNIKKGELGGWVEAEFNLSQENKSWVYDEAEVFGYSRVFGNAEVSGKVMVFGEAMIFGNAKIYDEAKVYGKVMVFDEAMILDEAWVYDEAEVFDDARISGNDRISGNAKIFSEKINGKEIDRKACLGS